MKDISKSYAFLRAQRSKDMQQDLIVPKPARFIDRLPYLFGVRRRRKDRISKTVSYVFSLWKW
jgi:hypothetical protein